MFSFPNSTTPAFLDSRDDRRVLLGHEILAKAPKRLSSVSPSSYIWSLTAIGNTVQRTPDTRPVESAPPPAAPAPSPHPPRPLCKQTIGDSADRRALDTSPSTQPETPPRDFTRPESSTTDRKGNSALFTTCPSETIALMAHFLPAGNECQHSLPTHSQPYRTNPVGGASYFSGRLKANSTPAHAPTPAAPRHWIPLPALPSRTLASADPSCPWPGSAASPTPPHTPPAPPSPSAGPCGPPAAMLPFTMKARPPNIFFSTTPS